MPRIHASADKWRRGGNTTGAQYVGRSDTESMEESLGQMMSSSRSSMFVRASITSVNACPCGTPSKLAIDVQASQL